MSIERDKVKLNIDITRPERPLRSALPFTLFLTTFLFFLLVGLITKMIGFIFFGFIAALLVGQSIKVAQQWEKAVVLRLGKFHRLAGPGLFLTIPIIDAVAYWIDQRITATTFNAEQTLTKDNVPVDVDAVLFWMVWDPEKAALEVENYRSAVAWASQTALRDIIGKTILSEMLAGRERIDQELQEIIDRRTAPWGIAVQSVEIRDVVIPEALQDAMSREAQAERERKARIILGSAEIEIAAKFAQAAELYKNNDTALQLRAMNILYEGLKEKGGMVVVPSQISECMNVGTILGISRRPGENCDEKNKGE